MAYQFEDMQKIGKDQAEQFSATAASIARGFQAIASETSEYSKRTLESASSHLEKIMGTKSLDAAIQLQSDYAKTQFEGFVAQASKIGSIYKDMAKDAFKPIETAVTKGTQSVQQ